MFKELHIIDLIERSNILPFNFNTYKEELWGDIQDCQHELATLYGVNLPNEYDSVIEFWTLGEISADESKSAENKIHLYYQFINDLYVKAGNEVKARLQKTV